MALLSPGPMDKSSQLQSITTFLASIILYYSATGTNVCEQLSQSYYKKEKQPEVLRTTSESEMVTIISPCHLN